MQFSSIFTMAVAVMLSAPTLACKCFVNGNQDVGRTQSCCNSLSGVFRGGNDCLASSISERLSNFRRCCGGQSDCDYPHLAEGAAGLEEQEFDHIKTIVVAAPTPAV
ncbi:hypothetical protein EYZ11_005517 [Aspergillus tanneri]|uniref:Extracellular membrane protein CFEM domain-containing protein n=1 Tax=Aspergillus tanneri TaxID=1220188 RepID=A0A4S3JID3_9EURO|nr:uncharacterized protein ATNIH1004_007554 [Aspergillus tanneri]KAA8646128.1 hypothetical protein ATNIH1004_007554 [Aspergillus tanneri]THC95005.1 hypothetical protein EYZ11_005517 [Aspergillus tanneri]